MTINLFNVKYTLKKEHILILCLFAVVMAAFVFFFEKSKNEEQIHVEPQAAEEINSEKEEIKLYITGCVKNPGIYSIEKGELLHEAIELAGGLTEDADDRNINMVYEIQENMMITILEKGRVQLSEDLGPGASLFSTQDNDSLRVNVNTADIAKLCTLPGIGETLASAIIDYRNVKGEFKNAADIINVPGIKGGKYEGIKDLITVK